MLATPEAPSTASTNMRSRFFVQLALLLCCLAIRSVAAAPIPLEDFFKDLSFDEIQISPDGTRVAALSKWKDHLNLFVVDIKTKTPRQLTANVNTDVHSVIWIGNNTLLFTTAEEGYATGRFCRIDVDGSHLTELSGGGRSTSFLGRIGDSTEEILVENNDRRSDEMDVYRLNLKKGTKRRVATNPGNVEGWLADNHGVVRLGYGVHGRERFLVYRERQEDDFKEIKRWDFTKGDVRPIAFHSDNRRVYARSSEGRDTEAIVLFDPAQGKVVEELFSDPVYDVEGVVRIGADRRVVGYRLERERLATIWADPQMKEYQSMLNGELKRTENLITSVSHDGKWMVILAYTDRDPGTYYLFNTEELTLEKLIARAPWIKPEQMSEQRCIQYTARDGLTIHGYLTIPANSDGKNLPLIVNPHGGPWVRDGWGYDPEKQFLASRGYAVLQMNFRGSTGYGLKHLQAGYGQWGLAMQDDITDGVKWCIEQGIADPKRIAIFGGSYGGYATMAGLAFTPDLYRCGVNYVGVTDIALLLKTVPKAWEIIRDQLEATTGNAKRDRDRLNATSPLLSAKNVRVPVFMAYGRLDERVDIRHATRLASILKGNGVPVELMIKDDEGHGYRRLKNRVEFYSKMEEFLAKNMQ
ncbi:S9 family peptidase [Opitutaceae bacterium EW11]|nr:S9 family peptidase [Opitutaceae bacterium EW11]